MNPSERLLTDSVRAESDRVRPAHEHRHRVADAINRLVDRVIAHWLLLVNLALLLILAGAVAVPALRAAGLEAPAWLLSFVYRLICLQRPAHSYFLFGHQLALEQRMIAMFAAQLLGGLAYGLTRKWVRGLNWRVLIVFSLPIAWDGFSQMFGLRESDWLTRTWTGGLFNLAFAFWLYPLIDRALARAKVKSTPGPVDWSLP